MCRTYLPSRCFWGCALSLWLAVPSASAQVRVDVAPPSTPAMGVASLDQQARVAEAPAMLAVSVDWHVRRPAHWSAAELTLAPRTSAHEAGWIKRHPTAFGALIGAGAGAGVGYAIGQNCNEATEFCSSKGGAAVVTAGLFAGVGALVGLVVGR